VWQGKKESLMNSKSTPQWKPLEFLPVFKIMIFEMLENAREQYSPLLEARSRPHVLDDHTLGRILNLYTEQLEDLWVWEKQLALWKELDLTPFQHHEISQLSEVLDQLKQTINKILTLTKQLQPHTIDRILSKEEGELALEVLFDSDRFEALLPEMEKTIEKMTKMEDQYQKLTQTLNDIFERFVPQIPPAVAEKCAEKLGVLPIHLQVPSLHTMFVDYCLFHYLQQGKTLMDEFMDQYVEELTDNELIVLNSFRKATFAVLKMEALLIEGAMTVYDLLKHERYILFDENLSEQAFPGMIIVCHLVKEPGFVFTTNTAIVLSPESKVVRLMEQIIQKTPEDLDAKGKTEYATSVLKIVFEDIAG
jgi:hypothetical protein